jgi:hypothetical protein
MRWLNYIRGKPNNGITTPQLLNDEGQTYFGQVLAQYQLLPPAAPIPSPTETAIRELANALAKKAPGERTWADLFQLEDCVVKLEPDDAIRRRAWAIRAKYRTVTSDMEFEAYQASNPPDPKTAPIQELRADTERILDEFHWIYAFAPIRDQKRDSLSKTVFWITLVLLVVVLAVAAVAYFSSAVNQKSFKIPPMPVLPIVIGMGMIGGYVSLQRRIQAVPTTGDPIVNISQISNSRFSVYLAPISGAVFAALLYLIFIGGLLKGPLFPTISTALGKCDSADTNLAGKTASGFTEDKSRTSDTTPAGVTPTTTAGATPSPAVAASTEKGTDCQKTVALTDFVTVTGPATGVDFAVLLVWAFIAGFAERFVPDTIDRLVSQASQK